MRLRSTLLSLAVAVGALVVVPTALGQATATPCSPSGFTCTQLAVPLDRTGAVAGAITLNAKQLVAATNPTRTAVVGLAGGPGQAALPAATDFATLLAPALATRDLLVFDQRGTGTSGVLSCPAFGASSGSIPVLAARCATQLGLARGFYRTTDSVEDLEALRIALGYDKLVLFGVSYGTKVALEYAAAHPANVEALVLDSVVPPGGGDVLNRSTFAATGRALRELCSGGACAGITTGVRRDLASLVRRVERRSLRGSVATSGGSQLPVRLTPLALYEILLAGDLNPTLRAELPSSLRSALRGDIRPILRLRARASGLSGVPTTSATIGDRGDARKVRPTSADSDALFAATRCEESAFPWDRAAAPEQRAVQAVAAAKAVRAQFKPFSYQVALNGDVIPLCVAWPNAAPAPAAIGPLPAVPTLVIEGSADLRTPVEDGRAVAATIAGAQLLVVPFAGHSVLGTDASRCAEQAVTAFFAGQPIVPCAATRSAYAPTPLAPTSLATTPGATRDLKAIAAVRATVVDVRRQLIGDAIAAGRGPEIGWGAAGLRSGTARVTAAGIRLRAVELVPGIVVSGTAPPNASDRAARLTVTGAAGVHGTVTLRADGSARARLDGHRVTTPAVGVTARTADRTADWPTTLGPHPALTRTSHR